MYETLPCLDDSSGERNQQMQENNLMYLLREMSGAKNGKQREATILFVSALNSVQTKDGCSYSMKALGWVNVMLCEFESQSFLTM